MGRARVVSKEQRPRSQMNKLLLVFAIGLGLLALAAGSSEEQNQVDSFESGLAREAREADPGKQRQNKGVNKRNNNKNAQRKKARSNNGKKGQRKNRNNRKNGVRNKKKKKKKKKKKGGEKKKKKKKKKKKS